MLTLHGAQRMEAKILRVKLETSLCDIVYSANGMVKRFFKSFTI
jgi:hypothetical protein